MKKIFATAVACLLVCVLLCGCNHNGEVRLPDVSYDNTPVDAYVYEIDEDEAVITGCTASNTVANIPEALEGKPVTGIAAGAFKGNGALDTVNLPSTVTSVGESAFAGCSKLRSVSLPSSLTYIGDDAFYGCNVMTVVNFPAALNHIGARAFSGCKSLETIAFPDNFVYIGTDAFAGTPWLMKQSREFVIQNGSLLRYNGSREIVTVPLDVRVISAAFMGNETVTKVILPDTVTHLTSDAFTGCTALTSISFGKKLSSVESAAFSGCTSLTTVEFPASIKAIDKNAFAGCTALTTVKGRKGSAAEYYALAVGLKFEAT